jgi:hypothetical protein
VAIELKAWDTLRWNTIARRRRGALTRFRLHPRFNARKKRVPRHGTSVIPLRPSRIIATEVSSETSRPSPETARTAGNTPPAVHNKCSARPAWNIKAKKKPKKINRHDSPLIHD